MVERRYKFSTGEQMRFLNIIRECLGYEPIRAPYQGDHSKEPSVAERWMETLAADPSGMRPKTRQE